MKYYITEHGKDRMIERSIDRKLIDKALKVGQVIETSTKGIFKIVTDFVILVIRFSSSKRQACKIVTCYHVV